MSENEPPLEPNSDITHNPDESSFEKKWKKMERMSKLFYDSFKYDIGVDTNSEEREVMEENLETFGSLLEYFETHGEALNENQKNLLQWSKKIYNGLKEKFEPKQTST